MEFNSEEGLFTAETTSSSDRQYVSPFQGSAELPLLPRAHAAGLRICRPFGPLVLSFP